MFEIFLLDCQNEIQSFICKKYKKTLTVILVLGLTFTCLLVAGRRNYISIYFYKFVMEQVHGMGLPTCPSQTQPLWIESTFTAGAPVGLEDVNVSIDLSRLLWMRGRCSEAVKLWQDIVKSGTYHPAPVVGLVWTSDTLPQEEIPSLAQFAYGKGLLAERAGANDAAYAWYLRSYAILPGRSSASGLVHLYVEDGNTVKVIELLQEMATVLPDTNADHWWVLGQIAEINKNWTSAAEYYGNAAQLITDPYTDLMRQGQMLQYAGALEDAQEIYRKALDFCPEQIVEPYMRLGHLARLQQDYDNALLWYKKAQEIRPDLMEPIHFQGRVFFELGNYEVALEYFTAARRLSPNNAGAFYYSALCLYQMGEEATAIDMLGRAVDAFIIEKEYYGLPIQQSILLGDWLLKQGNIEEAKRIWERALLWVPDNVDLKQRLGDLDGNVD